MLKNKKFSSVYVDKKVIELILNIREIKMKDEWLHNNKILEMALEHYFKYISKNKKLNNCKEVRKT